MKLLMVGLVGWAARAEPLKAMAAGPAPSQGQEERVKTESKGIFTEILRILIKWIFPIGAAYCFLFGIIGKGVKRGEWDMAAICTIAAIGLALFPKLLSSLFNMEITL